ncbi:MAG TPA: Tn3 family transposase [Chthonomonadaceae bacterium]|nr:Tn3 family transposase [Chthonomonadaceae bacterium]
MFKEADLRIGFTELFKSPTPRENLDREMLQRRLLLCLYGLGTNAGIKSMRAGDHGESYKDLLHVHRRYITRDHLRNVITQVINATLLARTPDFWGEGTTACASDSKKFGSWDQNLMTEWHVRYRGPGVMIYWHVERKALCVHSQLKTCSSSEVASMLQGVIHHNTQMTVEKNYVDSHGQSEVAFAFCALLGFELLPRLKGLHRQKLSRPEGGQADAYPNLQPVLAKAINWDLIRTQYDESGGLGHDVQLRQGVQKALNRGEAYHRLRRAVTFVNGGRFRVKTEAEQPKRNSRYGTNVRGS